MTQPTLAQAAQLYARSGLARPPPPPRPGVRGPVSSSNRALGCSCRLDPDCRQTPRHHRTAPRRAPPTPVGGSAHPPEFVRTP